MKPQSVCDNPGDKASTKQPAAEPAHPLPEDELGGGDICSPEEAPSTDDDQPLP